MLVQGQFWSGLLSCLVSIMAGLLFGNPTNPSGHHLTAEQTKNDTLAEYDVSSSTHEK